jgi:hypothetical protein
MIGTAQRIAKTSTVALSILWEEKFFETWRNRQQIVEELAKKGNHFSDAELGMALLRSRYLTRRGKSGSFEYIQKHPFAPEDMSEQRKPNQ